MKALNVQHSFFRPLWRRVLVVAVLALWAIFEFRDGSPYWGVLVAGIGIYMVWQFFVVFAPDDVNGDQKPDD